MKKFGFLFLLSILTLTVSLANAGEIELLNMGFIRVTGTPITESCNFSGVIGSATINIYNGAQNDYETGERVSASVISVNGIDVFDASEFNQNVTSLTKQINLNEGYHSNTISVQLMGKPGGKIRIEIIQEPQEAQEAQVILSDQDWAVDICKAKIEQFGDTEEARIEAVAIIKSLPGVTDAGYSLNDGSVWVEYDNGFDGVIMLGPEGTQGGWVSTQDNEDAWVVDSPSSNVLIYDPFKFAPVEDLNKIFNNTECPTKPDHWLGEKATLNGIYDFPNYETVIIVSHGGEINNKLIFVTGEEVKEGSEMWGADPEEKESIAIASSERDGKHYWVVKPSFFRQEKYREFKKNTVVYNASCHSLNRDWNNDDMYSAFLYKGANTYYGFSSRILVEEQQRITKELFKNLIENQLNTIKAFDETDRCGTHLFGWPNYRIPCLEIEEKQSVVYSCGPIGGDITIDGDPGDWNGIEPIIRDSAGNAPDGYADFISLHITHDDSYVYFLAEFADDLEVTEYPDSPFDLGIDYASLSMRLDTDLDDSTGCVGAEFSLHLSNKWHPAYNDYGWLGDVRDCSASSTDFPIGTVSTAIQGRFIESSVSRAYLELNMSGFDIELSAPLTTNIARYWLDGTDTPGPVYVDPAGGLWEESPQYINVNSSNAERVYCTIRTTTDGSIPEDPPVPTVESHDPFDVGVEYLSGSSGVFKFWGIDNGVKNLKVRFRGYNGNGYGPTSDVYFYRIDLVNIDPTIAQTPMSGPPGTTFVQWGTDFTPTGLAELHFRKPDGSEYPPEYQLLDEIGHFEIEYTAPINKPLGVYTWWAIDILTGEKSNEVSYKIE